MNASGFLGLHMITAGSYDGETHRSRTGSTTSCSSHATTVWSDLSSSGDVDRAGIYTSLIREQTPLDSIDFGFNPREAAADGILPR